MDWLVVWIVKIIALAARHVGLLISVVIAALLLALVYTVIILGSYESWDKSAVAIASGMISSVITTAFLLIVRWIGTKSSYFSKDILDVLGNILWRKCLWDTARARLRWHGYCRYETQPFGGLMGKRVLIRAIYNSGKWNPQLVVGNEVVYGFGTGDDLDIIGKDREAALEDARGFAERCGLSMKIEVGEIEGRVLETPTMNMFVVRNLLYRSAIALCEYGNSQTGGHEKLIGDINEMLSILDRSKIYRENSRWNRDERDDLTTSFIRILDSTWMAIEALPKHGKEPGSNRLVKNLANELSEVFDDMLQSSRKIVLAESNARRNPPWFLLLFPRRRISDALGRLRKRERAD